MKALRQILASLLIIALWSVSLPNARDYQGFALFSSAQAQDDDGDGEGEELECSSGSLVADTQDQFYRDLDNAGQSNSGQEGTDASLAVRGDSSRMMNCESEMASSDALLSAYETQMWMTLIMAITIALFGVTVFLMACIEPSVRIDGLLFGLAALAYLVGEIIGHAMYHGDLEDMKEKMKRVASIITGQGITQEQVDAQTASLDLTIEAYQKFLDRTDLRMQLLNIFSIALLTAAGSALLLGIIDLLGDKDQDRCSGGLGNQLSGKRAHVPQSGESRGKWAFEQVFRPLQDRYEQLLFEQFSGERRKLSENELETVTHYLTESNDTITTWFINEEARGYLNGHFQSPSLEDYEKMGSKVEDVKLFAKSNSFLKDSFKESLKIDKVEGIGTLANFVSGLSLFAEARASGTGSGTGPGDDGSGTGSGGGNGDGPSFTDGGFTAEDANRGNGSNEDGSKYGIGIWGGLLGLALPVVAFIFIFVDGMDDIVKLVMQNVWFRAILYIVMASPVFAAKFWVEDTYDKIKERKSLYEQLKAKLVPIENPAAAGTTSETTDGGLEGGSSGVVGAGDDITTGGGDPCLEKTSDLTNPQLSQNCDKKPFQLPTGLVSKIAPPELPSLVTGDTQDTAAFVNDLNDGNTSDADTSGFSSERLAARKDFLKKARLKASKIAPDQMALAEKVQEKIKAKMYKSLKNAANQTNAAALAAALGSPTSLGKDTAGKSVDDYFSKQLKKAGVQGVPGPAGGGGADLGFDWDDEEEEKDNGLVAGVDDSALDGEYDDFDVKGVEIESNTGENIFNIISGRYQQTAYPIFFTQKVRETNKK